MAQKHFTENKKPVNIQWVRCWDVCSGLVARDGLLGLGCTRIKVTILGLIPDESGPNPVLKMPGDFSSPGKPDLLCGSLQLKSPGNVHGRMVTATRASEHRVRDPGRRGPLARASWVLGPRWGVWVEQGSTLGWGAKVQIRELRQPSFPVLQITQTQHGPARL